MILNVGEGNKMGCGFDKHENNIKRLLEIAESQAECVDHQKDILSQFLKSFVSIYKRIEDVEDQVDKLIKQQEKGK